MKFYRNAVILLTVIGLLVVALVVLKNNKGNEEDKQEDNSFIATIMDIDTNEMTALTIENKEDKLVFEKISSKWQLVYPEGLRVNESMAAGIYSRAAKLSVSKIVEENAADLSVYGLDKPVVVTVKLSNGLKKRLDIGDVTPTNTGYYVREGDSNKVYVLSSYSAEQLLIGRNDIKSKTLFDVGRDDIKAFSLERNGEIVFTSEKTGEYDWTMFAPIQGNVELESINPMLDAVVQTSIREFIEENPSDLSKYGLDKPAYSLEVGNAGKKTKVLMGFEQEKGYLIYAKLSDSNEVFTMDLSPLNFLDKPLKEIIEVFAYLTNIWDVSRVEAVIDGETVNCELKTDKDDPEKDVFTVNGKDATAKDENDSQPFRQFYQAMVGLALDEIEVGSVPSGNADITITYYRKNAPEVVKIELVPKDDRYYYVMKDGKYSNILVLRNKFNFGPGELRESYKYLKEFMSKSK